ncbi:MAG TPA: histidine kinase [Chloroflexi bacterium]|nr:histidine kinase [Chloroflexota bacterium]
MTPGPFPALDRSLASLLPILRQREPNTALREGLERLLEAAGADGGALYFACGRQTVLLRAGHLPDSTWAVVEQWERTRPSPGDPGSALTRATKPAILQDGRPIVELPLSGLATVVGSCLLVFPPHQHLDQTRQAHLRALAAILGAIGGLLQELALTQSRLERAALLSEIGQALASTLDLPQLLQETMRQAMAIMQAQASSLMLLDNETNELVYEIVHGAKRDQLRQFRMPITQGIAGWVARTGQPLIVNDPGADPRFNRNVDRTTGFVTRSILCVPLQMKGRTIGVLQVLNKPSDSGFDEEDLELLRALASQAAIAVENARLYRNLQEEHDRIIEAQEEVRRELARNLHDGTVQLLSALAMNVEHARRLWQHAPERVDAELETIYEIANRAIQETRTLLFELRPIVLETQGLAAALESYVTRLNERGSTGTRVVLAIPCDLPRLPPKIERTLFAIIQEAVTNALKHAKATTIQVSVELSADVLEVLVQDDGYGFDLQRTQATYDRSGSLGLVNMRERAELIQADLRIESQADHGTRVVVRLALKTVPPTEAL